MLFKNVLSVLSIAALAGVSIASEARHVEVRSLDADGSMILHPAGHIELGHDGVLRSYNPFRQVIDYRQLSPQELSEHLERDASFLAGIGKDLHVSKRELIDNPVDGRMVTRRDQVLQLSRRETPKQKADKTKAKKISHTPKCKRELFSPLVDGGNLVHLAARDCPYPNTCACLADCPGGCNACYFPHGTGNEGYCMA